MQPPATSTNEKDRKREKGRGSAWVCVRNPNGNSSQLAHDLNSRESRSPISVAKTAILERYRYIDLPDSGKWSRDTAHCSSSISEGASVCLCFSIQVTSVLGSILAECGCTGYDFPSIFIRRKTISWHRPLTEPTTWPIFDIRYSSPLLGPNLSYHQLSSHVFPHLASVHERQ